uniref:Uncharacterized protein n=1 Tax=Anopheles darlingi TaxID=43151 RepID=A0A2M4D6K6_ANODA
MEPAVAAVAMKTNGVVAVLVVVYCLFIATVSERTHALTVAVFYVRSSVCLANDRFGRVGQKQQPNAGFDDDFRVENCIILTLIINIIVIVCPTIRTKQMFAQRHTIH